MERLQLLYVLEALRGPRRLFYYAPDEYARYLAERQVKDCSISLKDFKQSTFGKLLERPNLKAAQAAWGDGMMDYHRLQLVRAGDPLAFRLTLGRWGESTKYRYNYNQTSRHGYNLVVQLNFGGDHNAAYENMVKGRSYPYHPFHFDCHPGLANKDYSIAWARVDLSDDLSTALIEEVQSDWWKYASTDIQVKKNRQRDATGKWREWTDKHTSSGLQLEAVEYYLEKVLRPYGKVWEEAMLTATLKILWEEVGVKRIFYHTYETGCLLKNCRPPRSLYSKLPKRFCFQPTQEVPSFLEKEVKRLPKKMKGKANFWILE